MIRHARTVQSLRCRKHGVYAGSEHGKVTDMATSTDTQVLVPTRSLDDMLELARLAAERLRGLDPALASALAGASSQVRYDAQAV